MPLTSKGEEIKSALTKEYGEKKGEQVLYAGKNKGTFSGIDSEKLGALCDGVENLTKRFDSYCDSQKKRADDHRVIGGVKLDTIHPDYDKAKHIASVQEAARAYREAYKQTSGTSTQWGAGVKAAELRLNQAVEKALSPK